MNYGQKRITGRTPETYKWDDRRSAGARVKRPSSRSNAQTGGKQKSGLAAVLLPWVTLGIVVLMCSMIIGKWSYITDVSKDIDASKKGIKEAYENCEEARMSMNTYIARDYVVEEAGTRLHMKQPDAKDVKVLTNVPRSTSGVTQTAEVNTGSR